MSHFNDEPQASAGELRPDYSAAVASPPTQDTVSSTVNDEYSPSTVDEASVEDIDLESQAEPPNPAEFWREFGFEPQLDPDSGRLTATLPEGFFALGATSQDTTDALTEVVRPNPFPPRLVAMVAGIKCYFFRVAEDIGLPLRAELPDGVVLYQPGDTVTLPTDDDFDVDRYRCRHLNELQIWSPHAIEPPPSIDEQADEITTALTTFSLRGQAAQFEESAVKAHPVLGSLVLAGQCTVWYAAPNVGKTLIALKLLIDTVDERRLTPGNVYYVNADDSSEGFAQKVRLMDDAGVHTLAPGFRGFAPNELSSHLRAIASTNSAAGVIVIIDTLKKFADLMDKKASSAFGDACRHFAMKGGTVLGLAHTNKNRSASGKQTYAGVADIIQDFDAAYMITALEDIGDGSEKVVCFEAIKTRGPAVNKVAYAYATDGDISYEERLASVRMVDPELYDEFERFSAEKSDAPIIDAITACIGEGVTKKMELAKAAAERARVPARAAIRALEAYTGDNPSKHRWTYRVRERGAKIFELLVTPDDSST